MVASVGAPPLISLGGVRREREEGNKGRETKAAAGFDYVSLCLHLQPEGRHGREKNMMKHEQRHRINQRRFGLVVAG